MSGQWDFVTAAYAVTAFGTVIVLVASWRAMLAAEARVAELSRGDAE
jgi:hypothetical protein